MNKRLQHTYRMALLGLAVLCAVLFTFTLLQAQSPNSSSARLMPALPMAPLSSVPTPPVPGLSTYIKSQTAAIALGKAFFWDQQTGSDGVQACASCHFNAGADSRAINQVNPSLRDKDSSSLNFDKFTLGVLNGIGFYPNYQLHAGNPPGDPINHPDAGFGGYHDGDFPLHKPVTDKEAFPFLTATVDHHDVISSQGVFPTIFNGFITGNSVEPSKADSDDQFYYPDPSDPTGVARIYVRRVPPRNTPSAVNAVFNYRNFWDGRARNICNGANPFGERDATSHFFFASTTTVPPTAGLVRLQNSALCSQALGPPGSNFEMSGNGRGFRDIGQKLMSLNPLSDTGGPLGGQLVDPQDSVLGKNSKSPKRGINLSYPAMIRAAFQPIWWQSVWNICVPAATPAGVAAKVTVPAEALINPTVGQTCPASITDSTTGTVLVTYTPYTQMEYNFSLFWGLAIQQYESTLRADQTPFDKYLAQQKVFTIPANNVTNVFTFTLGKGNIIPRTVSVQAFNPALDVSDQDVFAFDNGGGTITGIGIVSGGINYSTGQVTLMFELPPPTGFPTKVAYSVGSTTPLTAGQLRGLLVFETRGKCIVCHGGPELTNASVAHEGTTPMERMIMGDFTVRVYDSGFYHIGVRPGHEDIGLADIDGIPPPPVNTGGLPLSDAAATQISVCNGGPAPIIPGRRGDGISPAPLSCSDPISQRGMVKAPGLRNLALTAPYFHNGGQLTLEQVVEFYDRGGDFGLPGDEKPDSEPLPDGTTGTPRGACVDPTLTTALVNCLMDPNVELLGLTQGEKIDLVDFLRNGLLDPRSVIQAAPFDHPSLMVPNGHVVDPTTGFPVPDPNYTDHDHPERRRALDNYMLIPQNGKSGGLPLPVFMDNLAKP